MSDRKNEVADRLICISRMFSKYEEVDVEILRHANGIKYLIVGKSIYQKKKKRLILPTLL